MKPTSTLSQRPFGRSFFGLCSVELFERLAYVAVRSVVPLYIMQATDPGGLHLTAEAKGTIFAWWFIFQSLLPLITGGFADRYGYRKMIAISVACIVSGYVLMAFMRDFWTFLGAVIVLAIGTALFKPALQGAIAQLLNKSSASLGWGIFYWVVNVGALLGPIVATIVLGEPHTAGSWRNLFLVSAAISLLNLTLLFLAGNVPTQAQQWERPVDVLRRTLRDLRDPRLFSFLLILSGFWLMMYQLWDQHPVFIRDWVDSSMLADQLKPLSKPLYERITMGETGLLAPQMLIWLNSLLVVLFVIPLSWLVRRMRTLRAMLIGMILTLAGLAVTGLTANGWIFVLGIAVFTAGEMLCAPKQNEYLGLIAPAGKKAQYLGYANIPVGIGGAIGAKLAGYLYGHYGEKATLALRYLAERTEFGAARHWDGKIASLEPTLGIDRSGAVDKLQDLLGIDASAATQLLWETYHPQYHFWIPILAVGLVSILCFAVYSHRAERWAGMNV
ncbi:MAG: MFS transporter [Planctomycetes bacterium]|nr:MFS transporter [Planctomycetota bacterium]